MTQRVEGKEYVMSFAVSADVLAEAAAEETVHCISCGVRHGLGVGCGMPLHETPEYQAWAAANPPVGERLARLEAKVDAMLANQARLEVALKRQGVGAWAGLA